MDSTDNRPKTAIDLSYPIKRGMPVFPGDGALSLRRTRFYERDGYNLSRFSATPHAGTHIDMPSHLTADLRAALFFDINSFIVPGVLIDCAGQRELSFRREYAALLQPGDALLIRTGYADLYAEPERYYGGFPSITREFAEFLCESEITILGLDTPSPDREPYALHKLLLEQGIFIIENLTNLAALGDPQPRSFTFMALPLKIDAEASPVRAAAIV